MNATNSRPAEVLLAEDNQDDLLLAKKGLESARFAVHLHHVPNGRECMAFLRKEGPYSEKPTPDLLLLDLNMPVMDGREVLNEILEDENLRHMPVVILTTSDEEKDLLRMYKLRCSSYIVKPIDFLQFQRVVQQITDYWFTVVVLPPRTE